MLRLILTIITGIAILCVTPTHVSASTHPTFWSFQSIDTMKYSRDPSREFLSNPQRATEVITQHVAAVAATGATHIGIATPYDEEFLPLLQQWVTAARTHGLSVWFRGNWSGWEQWFEYPKISRSEHIEKTKAFILAHPTLFEDGDVFTACPECENGGPGDPRLINDKSGHQQFLISEYAVTKKAFQTINKHVASNYLSMNGDVARLVMDKETTAAVDGIVTVDHYVSTPEKLNDDLSALAQHSGGKIVLGEWGAPIPDIHGKMTEQEQAEWISDALTLLVRNPDLVGLNYWTDRGGSTALWNDDGTQKAAARIISQFFTPPTLAGRVVDITLRPIVGATVLYGQQSVQTTTNGEFAIPTLDKTATLTVSAPRHQTRSIQISQLGEQHLDIMLPYEAQPLTITMRSWFSRLIASLRSIFIR